MSRITAILEDVLRTAGISHTSIQKSETAGQIIYNVEAEFHALVGPQGEAVHALDHIVKKILEKESRGNESEGDSQDQFLVDVNRYRTKHIEDLKAKALIMAERARSFQYDVELTPMNAYERLIIHTVLSDAPHIKTESRGEGRSRRVVIQYVA